MAGVNTESAKGSDIRTFAVSSAAVDHRTSEPSYFWYIRKNPNPSTNEGIAKYKLPEKAMMLSNTLEKGLLAKRVGKVKFRLALLKNSAMITVRILDTVANESEVIKDLINSGSLSMRPKSAPMPSKKITMRGNTKKSVKSPMINHCTMRNTLGSFHTIKVSLVLRFATLILKLEESTTSTAEILS